MSADIFGHKVNVGTLTEFSGSQLDGEQTFLWWGCCSNIIKNPFLL